MPFSKCWGQISILLVILNYVSGYGWSKLIFEILSSDLQETLNLNESFASLHKPWLKIFATSLHLYRFIIYPLLLFVTCRPQPTCTFTGTGGWRRVKSWNSSMTLVWSKKKWIVVNLPIHHLLGCKAGMSQVYVYHIFTYMYLYIYMCKCMCVNIYIYFIVLTSILFAFWMT